MFTSFPAKGIFKVHLMTVYFIPKEMSKHLKDKFSEMEGRIGHICINGSDFMS